MLIIIQYVFKNKLLKVEEPDFVSVYSSQKRLTSKYPNYRPCNCHAYKFSFSISECLVSIAVLHGISMVKCLKKYSLVGPNYDPQPYIIIVYNDLIFLILYIVNSLFKINFRIQKLMWL